MSGRTGLLVLAGVLLLLSGPLERLAPLLNPRQFLPAAAVLPQHRLPGSPRRSPHLTARVDAVGGDAQAALPTRLSRRRLAAVGLPPAVAGLLSSAAGAADVAVGSGLRARILRQNFAELTSPIFNIPPRRQTYPDWLEGTWLANQVFAGFVFPTLPKQVVMREEDVPGFKTCSIIDFADVGKSSLQYQMRWERTGSSVVEDIPFNLQASVGAHLTKGRVTNVQYLPDQDPNRLSVAINGSKNAERVELFVNSRETESPTSEPDLFFASEYRRQVTFSSRVVQGYNANYQHFKSFQRVDPNTVRLNVLTASYLDPLNPLYFQTFDKPVIVFSHDITLSRAPSS